MKENKYAITVIVPVYNNEKYIDECVTSIINQNFNQKVQVILINDGSIDKSLEVCKKYENEDIIVIDKKNSGVSDTRNLGLSKAQGKYILFLDSDDALGKKSLDALYNFFEAHQDEVDLITYPIIYNIDGKLKPHVRYDNMFYKGTSIYDLEKDYNLIQATVNVMIKNNYEKNELFDVNQNFSEDERFATMILMKKKKIGFVKEASYIYRRHVGTANDTITNPFYSFEIITSYYETLFNKFEKNGKVPKYVQTLYLNNLSWRIKQDDLFPYHYDEKEYENAINRIKKLLSYMDVEVILSLPYMSTFHQMYLLNLKGEKAKIKVSKNGSYKVECDNKIVIEEENITSLVDRFKIRNNEVILEGNLATVAFEIQKPELYLETIVDGTIEVKKIDTYVSNSSYYLSKIKTNTIYGYKIKLPIKGLKKFNIYVLIDGVRVPIYCKFNKFTSRKLYSDKIRLVYSNKKFLITKNNLINNSKDLLKNIITYIKNPKALVYRTIARLTKTNKKIWLYSDKAGLLDNGYLQFKHDITKNDGIERYYVYNESKNSILNKIEKDHEKYLLKFKTLKHKAKYINADKIITSFSDLQVYCPFNNGIKYYKDLTSYDLVYLGHGVLHASLINMYSKEYTEISKFVISSPFEAKNLTSKYNYNEEDLIKSGMPRTELKKEKVEVKEKILYAPSWREYLIGKLVNNKRKLKKKEFLESNYFKETYNFLHSKELEKILEENNMTLDFQLHPIFKEYGPLFELNNERVKIVSGKTVLEEYKIFITDFSSFQFDYIDLKRPIIYFVPDMEEFKAGLHTYRELDLKYEDAFGRLCTTSNELMDEMIKLKNNNFKIEKKYEERMNNFFYKTKNSCDIIYKEIKD